MQQNNVIGFTFLKNRFVASVEVRLYQTPFINRVQDIITESTVTVIITRTTMPYKEHFI